MTKAPRLVPALIEFPVQAARAESWGRLLELSPSRARLLTRAALAKGDGLFLSFQLADEAFKSLPARASYARTDADGYTEIHVEFQDEPAKRRLAKLLLELGAT